MTWSAPRPRNLKTFWCSVVNLASATQPSFCTASLLQFSVMALKIASAPPSVINVSSFSGRFNAKFFKHHTACSCTSGLDKCASMAHKTACIQLAAVTFAGSSEIFFGRTWRLMRSQVWAATCADAWPFIMRSSNFATSQPLFIVKGTVAATYNGIFASQESQMLCASSERQSSLTATKSWLGSWWEQKQRRITSKGHWITLEARNSRRAKPCSSHSAGTPLPNAVAIQIAATDSAQWRTACNSTFTSDQWDLESWTCYFSFMCSSKSCTMRCSLMLCTKPTWSRVGFTSMELDSEW